MTPRIFPALYQSPWWKYYLNIQESKAGVLSNRWHKVTRLHGITSLKKITIITINIIDMKTSELIRNFSPVYLRFKQIFVQFFLLGFWQQWCYNSYSSLTIFTDFVTVECNFLKSINVYCKVYSKVYVGKVNKTTVVKSYTLRKGAKNSW
jgi:hypothetical protein